MGLYQRGSEYCRWCRVLLDVMGLIDPPRLLLHCTWLPVAIYHAYYQQQWLYLAIAAPFIHILFAMVLHRISPARYDLAPHTFDPTSQPYYKNSELESERRHGYVRYPISAAPDGSKECVLVTPHERKRNKKCVLWIHGFGRYFSHCSATDIDFGKNVDLCGLDLPYHGRAYMLTGGHTNLDNPWNGVPPTSCWDSLLRVFGCASKLRASFYYEAYERAVQYLKDELNYEEVYFMCNSTSGLTAQCWIERQQDTRLSGIIFTAPYWWPTDRSLVMLKCSPSLWNVAALLFPLFVADDDGVDENHYLSDALAKAHKSGRTSLAVDPVLNPVDMTPYYVEWMAMASEAHNFLRKKSRRRGGGSERSKERSKQLPPALLLTNAGSDTNVDVEVVHEMFRGLYPTGMAHKIKGANHEIMLAKQEHFVQASLLIKKFIARK